jgi:hypothetical protein
MTDGNETPVQAGQEVVVYEGDWPSAPVAFNSARADAFYFWSQGLLDSRRGTTSAAYLPSELNVYANTFDQDGSWSYLAPYGYVWYPTVAATWRPYYYGKWRFYGGYGWTFIGNGHRWLYPTHHYGRWGLSPAQRWYWIPTLGWSPAWVHWAVSPGYVGWCPLGWNSQPVLGFWGHRGYYRGYNPGRAWTVVAAGSFSRGQIAGGRFDPGVFRGAAAPTFVVQPMQPRIASPRGLVVAPNARLAGNTAIPRGSVTPGSPFGSVATGSGPQSRAYAPPASSSRIYRPGVVRPPVVTTPAATSPPAYSSRTNSNRGFATPRGGGVRTAGAGTPPVIYYRGSPVPPPGANSPATAYERAGVAVPRGLPGSAGAPRQVMPAPPPQYRGPSVPYPGSGDPSPRTGGRMSTPGAAPRGGMPYAVPRSSGSYSGPGLVAPPSLSPRSMAPMRPMGPQAGTLAPPARMGAPAGMAVPRAPSAPPTSAPSQAVPRSGHSRR